MSNSKFTFDLSTGKDIHAPYIEANMTEAIKVTQSEFISTLFGDAKTRGVSRNAKVSTVWPRKELSMDSEPYPVSMDNYFSVGAFAGEGSGKDDSKRMMVVVADDYPLERLSVEPTYILQTSESKPQPDGSVGASYQVGFAITDGDNLKIADRLMQALYLQGHADKSGNNRVRLARLPQSTNNKHNKPFKTRITRWNPERRFGLMDVARALGVDLSVKPEPVEGVENSSSEKLDIHACVDAILDGLELHENINRLAMSYISQGMSRGSVITNLQALMQRVEVKDARWQERYEDIERSVDTAIEKRGKDIDSKETRWVKYDYDQSKVHIEEYLFDRFIGEGVLIVAGATGVGKTNALVTLCARVTGFIGADGEFLVPYFKRKVIYITEHASQVANILHALCRHTDSRVATPEFRDWFHIYNSKRLSPKIVADQIRKLLQEMIVYQDTPAGRLAIMPLVVFDTFAASFDLDDENNSSQVGRCVVSVKEISQEYDCHMIISAHTSKANKRADVESLSVVGSGSFENNAMMVGFIFKEGDNESPHRYFRIAKHRYQPAFKEVRFTSSLHKTIGYNKAGLKVDDVYMHLTVEESSEAVRIESKKTSKDEQGKQKLIEIIRDYNRKGIPITQSFLEGLGTGLGVRRLVPILEADARIKEVEIPAEQRKNGNQKTTLVVIEGYDQDISSGKRDQ